MFKNKYLIGTILMIFLMATSGFCQSRDNPVVVKVINKSQKLTKATGWVKNPNTGEWIANENCLFERQGGYWTEPTENFNWIQTWELSYENTKYYCVISEINSGFYTYPSIEKDWNSEKITKWLILTENQYKEFKIELFALHSGSRFIQSKINGELSDYYSHLGGDKSYTEQNIIKVISNSIREGDKGLQAYKFNSQHIDGKEIVRFRLQTYHEDSYTIDIDIQNQYFEVDFAQFIKMIL